MTIVKSDTIIKSDIKAVWNLLTGVNSWGRWNRIIKHAAIYGPPQPETRIKALVFNWDFNGRICAVEAPRYFHIEGNTIGVKVDLSWHLEGSNSITKVTVSADYSGWIARMFKMKADTAIQESIKIWLGSLKETAEKGTVAIPEDSGVDSEENTDNRIVQFTDPLSLLFGRKKSSRR